VKLAFFQVPLDRGTSALELQLSSLQNRGSDDRGKDDVKSQREAR